MHVALVGSLVDRRLPDHQTAMGCLLRRLLIESTAPLRELYFVEHARVLHAVDSDQGWVLAQNRAQGLASGFYRTAQRQVARVAGYVCTFLLFKLRLDLRQALMTCVADGPLVQ